MTDLRRDRQPIGTVVGNAGTVEFTFILKPFQARVGDVVALDMEVPGDAYGGQARLYVWARITDIRRFNPFFPFEAAQEIAGEGISLEDTVLSGTSDQLEAVGLVLGSTPSSDDLASLSPLTYPVKPASPVFRPPTETVRQLLVGGRKDERRVRVGSLIARGDVEVTLSAPKLVSRHLAILGMTGGGKTVAARRMIRELIQHRYPLLILDPHGDYIGLASDRCRELLRKESARSDVKLFFPQLMVQRDGESLITTLISQMTAGLTEAQMNYLGDLYARVAAGTAEGAVSYLKKLVDSSKEDFDRDSPPTALTGSWKPTVGAVRRSLKIVLDKLERMDLASGELRETSRLKSLPFEELPNPFSEPERIVRPGQVSILYLGGYDHIAQRSIVAIVLEALFASRADLRRRIAPFMTVVEEAHTFLPSAREGTHDAASLPVIRRVITEGRKFGTGLMLISQRPSRLDETIVSQCNSFLILRLVNPRDQTFVKAVVENLTESDARMVPGFGPGQGIVSGQVVRFPLPIRIDRDRDLLLSELGDEDFFEQANAWMPDADEKVRRRMRTLMERVKAGRRKSARKRTGKT